MMYLKAIPDRGPADKTGYPQYPTNTCRGVVCHSMVGSYAAARSELMNPARRASWHYSVLYDGTVRGHYDDEAVTWHCGSPQQNARLIGVEHEGGLSPYNEPLTPPQLGASVALVRWLSQQHGFPLVRGVGLFEHREVAPPAGATACPSARIPWAAYAAAPSPLPEEEDMKPILVWVHDIKKVYLVGPFGAAAVDYPADAAELKRLYGDHAASLSSAMINAIGVVK